MTDYEKQRVEEQQKEKRLREEVDAWFKKHPDVKFCSVSYPLAGYDLKVVGIEKMADGIYLLKNYMGGNYDLTHWGLDILDGVVGTMPKD